MPLFLITFFLAYGGMHVYAFLRAKAALNFGIKAGLLTGLFMLMMIFAPILIRQAEKVGLEETARIMSYAGYIWLGVIFLFFSSSMVLESCRLAVRAAEMFGAGPFQNLKPGARTLFFLPLFLSLAVSVYGYYEARNIKTENISIKTVKIPQAIGKLRIVQISDLHLGLIIRSDRLQRVIDIVRAASPDILVCTGDLVDGQINGLPGLAELFHEVNPQYGKYAITGNHEYIAGIDQSVAFIKKAGFTLLRDEGANISGLMGIAGVDDYWPGNRSKRISAEKDILAGLPQKEFRLLLKHRPAVDEQSVGLFDLQLSGHTHKGQIFPFSLLTKLYYPVHAGMSNLGKGSVLYVSRGTGTWGPPIRFLSPPEVTVIDIVYKQQAD